MSRLIVPTTGAVWLAQLLIDDNETGSAQMRFYKAGFAPTVQTSLADLQANECDFDGYSDDLVSILFALWWGQNGTQAPYGPLVIADGVAARRSYYPNLAAFYQAMTNKSNLVGGAWVEMVTIPAGPEPSLLVIIPFTDPVPMAKNGDSLQVPLTLYFGGPGTPVGRVAQ